MSNDRDVSVRRRGAGRPTSSPRAASRDEPLPTEFARDFNHLTRAFSEAGTEVWVGSLRVLTDLFLDVNEAAHPRARPRGGRAAGGREDAAQARRDRRRGEGGLVEDYGRTLNDLARTHVRALDETSELFRRFYRRLADIFDL